MKQLLFVFQVIIILITSFIGSANEFKPCFKCEVEIILNSGEFKDQQLYEASDRIAVGGDYKVNAGSEIQMKAGNTITLKAGTIILNGSKYLAQIAPCSNSICSEDFKYTKYFTPNGDGVNDTWTVAGVAPYTTSKIFIFDRYGKLIKELYGSDESWDGTFNSKEMPSNDYWFKVLYECEGKKLNFAGHFTLKR
ncbi:MULTISPECIES: T9SS type B sorting domain-containing protein [unclassified Leeuwenhoekiella]|uniref:T9SS type B sorting domain-containing protein n=1 Tax=unclassified Leeuwenhoekiella TaxID=2615029 RepID=UPI0025B7B1C5|nr:MULTISPECIES: T9SS type B sorting domain-containing protein [unclassified Leeuwenhoekiella]